MWPSCGVAVQGHDARVHGAAAGAQLQGGAAAVAAVGGALDQAAFHEASDGPADGHLVHDDALPHIRGGEGGKPPQGGHHPPLCHREAERLGVEVVQRFAYELGQDREPVGEEFLQFEGLQSVRHDSYI